MKRYLSLAHSFSVLAICGIIWIAALSSVGCSNNSSGRFEVQGEISLNGTPVEAGTISFSPQGENKDSRAAMPFQGGRYEIPVEKGLVPGKYLVQIFAEPVESESIPPEQLIMNEGRTNFRPPVQPIPAKFNTKSDQIVEVTADGENEFNFPIKTK